MKMIETVPRGDVNFSPPWKNSLGFLPRSSSLRSDTMAASAKIRPTQNYLNHFLNFFAHSVGQGACGLKRMFSTVEFSNLRSKWHEFEGENGVSIF
jgi:hypothetical protein